MSLQVGWETNEKDMRNITIRNLWGIKHDALLYDINQKLVPYVKLAYQKTGHSLCMLTDASDTHWVVISTQIKRADLGKYIQNQNH